MTKRWYGHIPDKPDPRDFLFRAVYRRVTSLPASVDLRSQCSPVRDQGQLGSCTGFSLAVGLREFLEIKMNGSLVPMSPLFVYYEERALEHDVNQDAGGQIRDGMKILASKGCSPEVDDPYDIAVFTKKPSCKALRDAKSWRISAYHRIAGLEEMQSCLASGAGLVLGFTVYESFELDAVAKTGLMPMPGNSEQIVGGHAVFACGYRADAQAPGGGWLIIKNSWGTDWGMAGYFQMPYAYVTPDLVSDAWTATA